MKSVTSLPLLRVRRDKEIAKRAVLQQQGLLVGAAEVRADYLIEVLDARIALLDTARTHALEARRHAQIRRDTRLQLDAIPKGHERDARLHEKLGTGVGLEMPERSWHPRLVGLTGPDRCHEVACLLKEKYSTKFQFLMLRGPRSHGSGDHIISVMTGAAVGRKTKLVVTLRPGGIFYLTGGKTLSAMFARFLVSLGLQTMSDAPVNVRPSRSRAVRARKVLSDLAAVGKSATSAVDRVIAQREAKPMSRRSALLMLTEAAAQGVSLVDLIRKSRAPVIE